MHVQTWNDIDKQAVENRMNNYEWNSNEVYWFLSTARIQCVCVCVLQTNVGTLCIILWPQNLHSHSFLWNFVAPPIFFPIIIRERKRWHSLLSYSYFLSVYRWDLQVKYEEVQWRSLNSLDSYLLCRTLKLNKDHQQVKRFISIDTPVLLQVSPLLCR
jgi:hypothetical protein